MAALFTGIANAQRAQVDVLLPAGDGQMTRYIQRSLDIDYDKARYPLLALPKYNGVFAHNTRGALFTREHNIVNNKHVRDKFNTVVKILETGDHELEFEMVIPGYSFNETSGVVRSADDVAGKRVILMVLDKYVKDLGYKYRWAQANKIVNTLHSHIEPNYIYMAPVTLVVSAEEARRYTASMIALRDPTIEGAVFRNAFGLYKEGRSTMQDCCFLRDKETATVDGIILEVYESVDKYDVAKGMAHSALVRMEDGSTTVVSMTNNLTDAERVDLLRNKQNYYGKGVQFLNNPCEGMPYRHTRFDLWRPDKDESLVLID